MARFWVIDPVGPGGDTSPNIQETGEDMNLVQVRKSNSGDESNEQDGQLGRGQQWPNGRTQSWQDHFTRLLSEQGGEKKSESKSRN